MISLEIDLSVLDELAELSGSKLDDALEKCVERGAEIGFQAKLREIALTDARPIPTRQQVAAAKKQLESGKKVRVAGGEKSIGQGGEPAWKRSGEWADGQRIEAPSQFERQIVTTGPAEAYEERLAILPTGALGINRTNKAAQTARDKTEQQLEAVIEQELRNALNL